MDPNITKLLEEDEVSTVFLHNFLPFTSLTKQCILGKDVDAFSAELNRDIEGNASTSNQPSDSNTVNCQRDSGSSLSCNLMVAASSQGINHTSQFLQQGQASGHDEDTNLQNGKNILKMEPKAGSKEDSRASEASRRVVREEEERVILHTIPLQKECVEERMRSIIANLIRLSKQRVDMEKLRHRTIITSDVRQTITIINSKAREEWEKKQAETEKTQKLNETENDSGIDGDREKGGSHIRSAKAKDEDDKMCSTAANVAVRAATGVDDVLSRWQLMIEAKQKLGGTETLSGSQPRKDVVRKPLPISARNTRESQEAEKQDRSPALNTPASVRKVMRNQIINSRVSRCISVKDVISILEREPQSHNMKVYAGVSLDIQMIICDQNVMRVGLLNYYFFCAHFSWSLVCETLWIMKNGRKPQVIYAIVKGPVSFSSSWINIMANQGKVGDVVAAQLPTSFGHELRACLRCRLIKTYDQFLDSGCENCPFFKMEEDPGRVANCTTPNFNGVISIMDTTRSWAARWLRTGI
ncbi:transcription initiation factor TFIID subunit 4b-like [Dorcoceras hygrometricum]|uniref:Transcription initiation factor TFIID subunit 4b-like n=1 Tax=Dorcoceras hygrometricum TaxID=472368 RepID=A0A2Z7D4V0_9LAMI|nr:transcription initiation factor TFIID subunit 4b-like [Dorcoceras hygrometricum]